MNKSLLLLYSMLSLPLAFVSLPLYIYVPDFYVSSGYVSLSMVGFILLFIRLFDAIQDPVIGIVFDRYPQCYLAYLMCGLICMVAGFYIVFHPVELQIVSFFVGMILCTLGLSIVSILFHSLGGLWKTGYAYQKTQVTSWREAIGLVAVLCVVTMPIYFSFTDMFTILVGISFIALLCFSKWLSIAPLMKPRLKERKLDFKAPFKTIWSRYFYGIFLISHIANAIPAVLVIFFIRDYLQAEEFTGLFLILYFISGAAAMGIWQKIAKKYGKYNCWLASMVIALLSFIWVLCLSPNDVIAYGLICILSGSAVGADLTLPPSILADYTENNISDTSQCFSIMTMIPKLSLAFASALAFHILDLGGYGAVATGQDSHIALLIVYCFVPSVVKLCAIILCLYVISKQHLKVAL